MSAIISIHNLGKTCATGFTTLDSIDREIRRGEIFALLGPNGAGKTTLISIVCGIVRATSGTVLADGHDSFDAQRKDTGIADLLRRLGEHGLDFKDLYSSESSLEDIFVSLVHRERERDALETRA